MLSRKKYLVHYLEGNALNLFYYLLPTDSADACLNITELAIHWAAVRLYGIEGHGPYDDLALEFRFLFWYSAFQTC